MPFRGLPFSPFPVSDLCYTERQQGETIMGTLGWSEILVIFVLALVIFGPRKLPELGRSLGKGLSEFKRASSELRRTWEQEVESEQREIQKEFQSLESEIQSVARDPLEDQAEEKTVESK